MMQMCDNLKEEREGLIKSHDTSHYSDAQDKLMEVCEVCGAFLIVGDAQQRIEDHLTGKQHLGYSKLRRAVEEVYEQRRKRSGGGGSDGDRGDRDSRRRNDDRRHRYRRDREPYGGRGGGEKRDRNRNRDRGGSSIRLSFYCTS